jgi:hypothetical protein
VVIFVKLRIQNHNAFHKNHTLKKPDDDDDDDKEKAKESTG